MSNKIPSIEERVEEKRAEFSRAITIPRETHYINRVRKCEDILRTTLTQDRHAIGEMILEWAEFKKNEKIIHHGMDCQKGKRPCGAVEKPEYLADRCETQTADTRTLTDLETFIKSEVMEKE